MTAQCVGRFFRTDGKYLSRAYKEHLSGFDDWEQKEHAGEWVLLEENMGERLSIDETMLHHDSMVLAMNGSPQTIHFLLISNFAIPILRHF